MQKIREIFAEIGLLMRLDSALVEKCEELQKRIEKLEADYSEALRLVKSCETRCAELMYIVKAGGGRNER